MPTCSVEQPLPRPRISVNIPTWKRRELLSALLEALSRQGLPESDYEVLVCDSGSSDGTSEMVRAFASNHRNVRLLEIETNTLTAKRNALAVASHAPILLLLDDDVMPAPGFLLAHLEVHRTSDGIVGCGAIRFPLEWTEASNYFRFRDSRHIGPGRPDIDATQIPGKNWTVMNMSVKATDVRRLGLMDESFVRYGGEDHEFAERWQRGGIKGVFVPGALVWHHEAGGAFQQYERKQYFCGRYGFGRLLEVYPDYLSGNLFQFLEPADATKPHTWLREIAVRFIFGSYFVRPVRWWLERTDAIRWAYAPLLFRYVIAAAYAKGARDRTLAPDGGWF